MLFYFLVNFTISGMFQNYSLVEYSKENAELLSPLNSQNSQNAEAIMMHFLPPLSPNLNSKEN